MEANNKKKTEQKEIKLIIKNNEEAWMKLLRDTLALGQERKECN